MLGRSPEALTDASNATASLGIYVLGQPPPHSGTPFVPKGAGDLTPVLYAYNDKNQMVEAKTASSTVTNTFNAEGLRVSKTVEDVTTWYCYEFNQVIKELDSEGSIAYNTYGTNLISRDLYGEKVYYIFNGHGDVTGLLSSSGAIIATYYYDAYGNILEQSGNFGNPYRYAGYMYDSETELYNLNARFYDAKLARFMQEDTYLGDHNDPLSLNLYAYCLNDPIKYHDPTGRSSVAASVSKVIKDGFNSISKLFPGSSSSSSGGANSSNNSLWAGIFQSRINDGSSAINKLPYFPAIHGTGGIKLLPNIFGWNEQKTQGVGSGDGGNGLKNSSNIMSSSQIQRLLYTNTSLSAFEMAQKASNLAKWLISTRKPIDPDVLLLNDPNLSKSDSNDYAEYVYSMRSGYWFLAKKDHEDLTGNPLPDLCVDFDDIYSFILDYNSKQTPGNYLTRTQIEALFMINDISYLCNDDIKNAMKNNDPLIFAFEGAGNYSGWENATDDEKDKYHPDGRYGAMLVVVQDGKISYITRNASTLPDRYDVRQGASANYKYPITIDEGIYSFEKGAHGDYQALHVNDDGEIPGIRYTVNGFVKTNNDSDDENYHGTAIHLHRGGATVSLRSVPHSTGCIIIKSSDWSGFAKEIGISNGNVSGILVVNRSLDSNDRYYK